MGRKSDRDQRLLPLGPFQRQFTFSIFCGEKRLGTTMHVQPTVSNAVRDDAWTALRAATMGRLICRRMTPLFAHLRRWAMSRIDVKRALRIGRWMLQLGGGRATIAPIFCAL